MNSRRMIILLVAIMAGAMASFAIYTYIGNVKTEATQGSQMVEVWRVTEVIPKGTPANEVIEQGFIVKEQVEISTRPLTAIDDPTVEILGLVAVIDIPANVALVEGLFVEPGVVATGITDRLAERGLVTMTLSLDQVKAAAYLIEPGDRVNILTVRDRTAPAEAAVDGVAAPSEEADPVVDSFPLESQYVYQYVEVIAVGENLTSDLGTTADTTVEGEAAAPTGNRGLITIAVPPEAVQIILNAGVDRLYFSLVPQNYVPAPAPAMEVDDPNNPTFPGEREGQLTPYWNVQDPAGTPESDQ